MNELDTSDFEPIKTLNKAKESSIAQMPKQIQSELDTSDFEMVSNSPIQPKQDIPLTSPPKKSLEPQDGDLGLAAVGTLANIGADIGKGTVDMGAWVLDKLNVIAPETAAAIYESTEKGSEVFRPTPEDPFGQAMEKYPKTSMVGRVVGDFYALSRGQGLLGKSMPAQIGMGGVLSTTFGETPMEKDIFAILGASGQPILSGLGYGAKYLATKMTLGTKLKNIVTETNKLIRGTSVNDDIGESVTNMYVTSAKVSDELYTAATANNPVHKLETSLEMNRKIQNNYGLGLTGKEKSIDVLGDLSAGVKKYILDTEKMAGANLSSNQMLQNYYRIRNLTNQAYKSVRNGRLSKDVADDIAKLRQAAENDLVAALKKEGNLNKWQAAKKFHRETIVPLEEFGADDIAKAYATKEANPALWNKEIKNLYNKSLSNPESLKATLKSMDKEGSKIIERGIISEKLSPILDNIDDFTFSKAYTEINAFTRQFKGIISADSIATLNGISKLIQQAGSHSKNIQMAGHIGTIAAGGALGGYFGQKIAGDDIEAKLLGGGIGSAAGIVGLPVILMGIRDLLKTPQGQKLLMKIGSSSEGSKYAGDVMRTLYTTWLPTYIRATKDQQNKQGDTNAP